MELSLITKLWEDMSVCGNIEIAFVGLSKYLGNLNSIFYAGKTILALSILANEASVPHNYFSNNF